MAPDTEAVAGIRFQPASDELGRRSVLRIDVISISHPVGNAVRTRVVNVDARAVANVAVATVPKDGVVANVASCRWNGLQLCPRRIAAVTGRLDLDQVTVARIRDRGPHKVNLIGPFNRSCNKRHTKPPSLRTGRRRKKVGVTYDQCYGCKGQRCHFFWFSSSYDVAR